MEGQMHSERGVEIVSRGPGGRMQGWMHTEVRTDEMIR